MKLKIFLQAFLLFIFLIFAALFGVAIGKVEAQKFNIVIFDECTYDETGLCYQDSQGVDTFNASALIDNAITSFLPNYTFEATASLDICGLNKIQNRKTKLNTAIECAKGQGLYNPRRINIFVAPPALIDGTAYIGHLEYKSNAILSLHPRYSALCEYWSNAAIRKLLRSYRKNNPVRHR